MVTKAINPQLLKSTKLITGEELAQMSHVATGELVKGVYVKKMPTGYLHGIIEGVIAGFLFIFVRNNPTGQVLTGEVGIYTSREPDTVRAADIAYISFTRLQKVKSRSFLDVAPELVVEVLSPNDMWHDVHTKLAEYFAAGVQLIWVVDPQLEQIHVYTSLDDVMRLTSSDELTGGNVLPGFQVALSDIFSQVKS